MLDHVRGVLPEEGCGFLAGKSLIAEVALPVTNRLHSTVRFEMEPQEQLKAMLWMEENGLDIAAIYHSHPEGSAVPSPTDLAEHAYPDAICLILSSTRADDQWQIRAFRIMDQRFEELSITNRVNIDRPGGQQ